MNGRNEDCKKPCQGNKHSLKPSRRTYKFWTVVKKHIEILLAKSPDKQRNIIPKYIDWWHAMENLLHWALKIVFNDRLLKKSRGEKSTLFFFGALVPPDKRLYSYANLGHIRQCVCQLNVSMESVKLG